MNALTRTLVVLLVLASLLPTPPAVAAEEVASVKGVVTIDGKPLADRRIIFHLGDGQFVGAKTKADGAFRVDRVPAGTYTVTVEGPGLTARYASEEKSVLRVAVKKGNNELNFDLSSR